MAEMDKAKLRREVIKSLIRTTRRYRFTANDIGYIAKIVKQKCGLKLERKGKTLPTILTEQEFKRFFEVVDRAEHIQHSLMLRLLFFAGVRNFELCNIKKKGVNVEEKEIRITQGKGSKDRTVIFAQRFALPLATYMASIPDNEYLFETNRNGKYTTRRIQQIVKSYVNAAGIKATPHTFRHQLLSWLTKHSGLADAELQLISGHSSRESLKLYQHMTIDNDLHAKYEQGLRDLPI